MRISFSTIFALSGLFASAIAHPAFLVERQLPVCSSGSPLCCDVDVLGVADLDCITPPASPTSVSDFNSICAGIGKIDMCCLLPILEQGIICSEPA
ncbi:Bhp2, hydrophobin class II [Cadophora sp. MPI-SDFR-AT-0126]|nr:Bhp2, hydrophobin class II [Leotiomycetes sp. MPI-SDFR-AT-0126]